ncbi:MAG: ComEA family DNA-binding protein [Acidimicrobiia bacterium]|nr:ComEA family DNA-binding protein [Acidimicrobiia bacterium]
MEDKPQPSVRLTAAERCRELWDDYRHLLTGPRLAIVVIGLVLVVGILIYRMWGVDDLPPVEMLIPQATPLAERSFVQSEPVLILVHVAGAVKLPGVYKLQGSGRVVDLVQAAGGLTSDADVDRVNLADVLFDGQWIYVPRIGQKVIPMPVGGIGGGSGSSFDRSGPLNINSATSEQLQSLPGVGPAIASAIVKHRDRVGGFSTVDGLLAVSGIGPSKLAQIRDLVTV